MVEGGKAKPGHERGLEEDDGFLARFHARNEDERGPVKRERIRKGNRWMGLAAYPANAPSDIVVTST